ncbi:hypothetical protein AVDCRST_MAG92-5090, partial [uncultured Coleofasciculus sp.]
TERAIAFPFRRMKGDNSTNPKRDHFQQRFANVIAFRPDG